MSESIKEKLVDYFHHLVLMNSDAFAPRGSILLYSGPSEKVLRIADIPNTAKSYNHSNSERTVAVLNARRLDETVAGKLLFDKIDIYKTMFDLVGNNDGLVYANAINFEVSRMFTQQAEGRVYTAVCGAAKDRIFYTAELPELIANKDISHINGYEVDRFRRLYDTNPDRAFDHICQTEQRLIFAIAQNTGSRPAFLDHAERRDLRRTSKRGQRDDSGALIMGQVLNGISLQAREDFATAKLAMLAVKRSNTADFSWKKSLLAGTQLG